MPDKRIGSRRSLLVGPTRCCQQTRGKATPRKRSRRSTDKSPLHSLIAGRHPRRQDAARGSHVTYVRNVGASETSSSRVSTQVFRSGSSSFGQSVGQLTSSGVWMSVEQALGSKSSQIAV